MSDLFDLTGRTALVTGSSRGLGRCMAEGLARAGAAVVLNGVDPVRLDATAVAFRDAGLTVHQAVFDVTDEAGVKAAFERFDREGLSIDILVNNAGIQLRKPMLELELADFRRVMDTNLTSAFIIGREAARRMVPRGSGKIVNVGSVMSQLARATVGPYVVAKTGLKALTQMMAAEWAEHGIQANAIGPGYMSTDMTQVLRDDPKFDGWVKARTPSRRWGQPDELIGTCVFLASAASNYVNGQIVYVDGGMTAVL